MEHDPRSPTPACHRRSRGKRSPRTVSRVLCGTPGDSSATVLETELGPGRGESSCHLNHSCEAEPPADNLVAALRLFRQARRACPPRDTSENLAGEAGAAPRIPDISSQRCAMLARGKKESATRNRRDTGGC